MSTIQYFNNDTINAKNKAFSRMKVMVETAFYGQNVTPLQNVSAIYELAKANPDTIVTDMPVKHTDDLGLPSDAKVLVYNHGKIVGRTAKARRILQEETDTDATALLNDLQEAIYQDNRHPFWRSDVLVGLDKNFMVKAHVCIPKGYEHNLYSYVMNFQFLNETYQQIYDNSKQYDEPDIYLYVDPDYHDPKYPDGLALFDREHNVAALLGMRYFGEMKKGTLTLAWSIAHRHGYTACHGGLKSFHFKDQADAVFAMYGLSGSGKSTLTLAKHQNKYDITVLHDDAFVISRADGSSTAMEPAYFDKTNDYTVAGGGLDYCLTVMNDGVTLNEHGQKVLVTEDLRNGNGRMVKSRYITKNRVDYEAQPISALFWIMKDNSLPPVMQVTNPVAAATIGLTLATKHSTAENVSAAEMQQVVIIPYANPFRLYPLVEDYQDFKALFEKRHAQCYILNTSAYLDQDIPKELTLGAVEDIVDQKAKFKPFLDIPGLSYLPYANYPIPNGEEYKQLLQQRFQQRLAYVTHHNETRKHALPDECTQFLTQVIKTLK
ncbi:phosphoenolpyruvate carboxykinase [Agrilactobacillus composti DSM 18527 = JCM 14202]|uniref:phosphoenolpyruvate carboxykinase (ATP) n=1 Tax=Agrilactobacillus composti DSM 18527 = JCM 14202 TaxID=1423734 RepID=X0PEK9_9LACO|nr:phosphoenolpyruvate carboxykinase (ATP) [Agrilactobacillus composti]KRM32549.1 phosphoenolpyruvate carboxykinase [Agrilactobacillus composti DSM 18527 = JCM 14202]GAF40144.1 phosphoenolpyruvate carboxykinase [Agrilactobacillus composti DSM 18527 = JCM 14202]